MHWAYDTFIQSRLRVLRDCDFGLRLEDQNSSILQTVILNVLKVFIVWHGHAAIVPLWKLSQNNC